MQVLLRRTSVRLRLTATFVAAGIALLALAGVAVVASRTSTAASVRSAGLAVLSQESMQVKFGTADWNGWQTAYALDANLDAATVAEDVGSRASFLASADALRAALDVLAAEPGLTADEQAQVQAASAGFEQFMAIDADIIAAYRSGDAAAVDEANGLVLVEEIAVYEQVSTAVQGLSDSLGARAAAAADEAEAAATAGGTTVMIIAGVTLALFALLLPLILRSVLLPVRQLEGRLHDIADGEGDLTVGLDVQGTDELSRTASSFNRFVDQIADVIRAVGGSAASVAAAAEQMSGTAAQIGSSAEETSVQAGTVAAAAEQLSRSVEAVAAGTEEMGSAIREISRNASQAADVAAEAVRVADATNTTVSRLGDSSAEIGAVVKTITQIAEQTNLLALNATIEAARAGEAGKGFAVVAGEVKELAQETARATEDIARKVEAIQADTRGAVDAIGQISEIVGRINDYQMTISSAVEEQTATTTEMSRSVVEAATGSGEIAANVTHVASAASMTTEGVGQTQQAVLELARMSALLETQVARFRV
ncbi:methyl-accepting chemotaxis protein [Actinotalea sp.]|uniref:methyl-accepting chemotaxis protein n=1 Tax=Actinotalea sp. TaxID=1872145 RepID=UPI002C38FE94|nr:methyl-accepting chemotaxis protein [Actinotalea sp.]HQY32911.1 methyl-accepting chemotaxis protein [Actinotalea sp.]HRA49855.1 methyl-accepting chemotaxis protein [Actinotalea sp.]